MSQLFIKKKTQFKNKLGLKLTANPHPSTKKVNELLSHGDEHFDTNTRLRNSSPLRGSGGGPPAYQFYNTKTTESEEVHCGGGGEMGGLRNSSRPLS
jgi:hypothetical protein